MVWDRGVCMLSFAEILGARHCTKNDMGSSAPYCCTDAYSNSSSSVQREIRAPGFPSIGGAINAQ